MRLEKTIYCSFQIVVCLVSVYVAIAIGIAIGIDSLFVLRMVDPRSLTLTPGNCLRAPEPVPLQFLTPNFNPVCFSIPIPIPIPPVKLLLKEVSRYAADSKSLWLRLCRIRADTD